MCAVQWVVLIVNVNNTCRRIDGDDDVDTYIVCVTYYYWLVVVCVVIYRTWLSTLVILAIPSIVQHMHLVWGQV